MIYWGNRILTNVKIRLGDRCKNVVSFANMEQAKFPTVSVMTASNTSTGDDLEYEENAVRCGVSVSAYSKVSVSDAMEILSIADGAMFEMGFKRRSGPFLGTGGEAKPDIYHATSRYARVIGANDEIPLFEE